MRNAGILALAFGPFVAIAIIFSTLANAHPEMADRDQMDEWCKNATMTVGYSPYKIPSGSIEAGGGKSYTYYSSGTAYGASQLQRTDHSYIVCDDGTRVSATDGHRLDTTSDARPCSGSGQTTYGDGPLYKTTQEQTNVVVLTCRGKP